MIIHEIKHARQIISSQKSDRKTIGFVPTMGALHEGHLALIDKSARENDFTVVSIFVNPIQFGPHEDYEKYPRALDNDSKKAYSAGANLIFNPEARQIIGDSLYTFVDIQKLPANLCGEKRPGHFRGVCTIVTKLFNIITPHRAYFGKKDIQQLLIIKKMTADLNLNVDIIACPIVRDKNGLALSSRNQYLPENDKTEARIINQALKTAVKQIESGEKSSQKIISFIREMITQKENARIDYIKLVNQEMESVDTIEAGHILALAVYFGQTRLIDNHIIGEKIEF